MSLEEIERHIKREEKEQVNKILSEAKAKYYSILSSSSKTVEKIRADNSAKMKAEISRILDTETNAAKAEAERHYNLAFSDKIKEISRNIKSTLESFVATESYGKLLYSLIKRAVDELGQDSTIYVNERDLKNVQAKFPDLAVKSAKAEFIGGAKAISKDGFRSVDLSLEDILRRRKDVFTAKLSQRILR
jgi:vacuolar-type H+-ATPase subunit E/Vma4